MLYCQALRRLVLAFALPAFVRVVVSMVFVRPPAAFESAAVPRVRVAKVVALYCSAFLPVLGAFSPPALVRVVAAMVFVCPSGVFESAAAARILVVKKFAV